MSSLNYMELCRLCLINERVSIPIFEEEGDARQLFMKIASCLPVKVAREDRLPKKICNDCLYKLENVYSFWNTTANAEKQLLEWLGEMAVEKRANSEATSIITTKTEQQLVPKEETIESDQPKGSGEDQPGSEEEEEEEEESEEEGSNSDESGGGGDAGPKEEAESEEEPYEELEPTTFVNVSLACDEAGPSGMQQRTAPSTSTAPSGFTQENRLHGFGFARDTRARRKIVRNILPCSDNQSNAKNKKYLEFVRKVVKIDQDRRFLNEHIIHARRRGLSRSKHLQDTFVEQAVGDVNPLDLEEENKPKVKEEPVEVFQCDMCGNSFFTDTELREHHWSVHQSVENSQNRNTDGDNADSQNVFTESKQDGIQDASLNARLDILNSQFGDESVTSWSSECCTCGQICYSKREFDEHWNSSHVNISISKSAKHHTFINNDRASNVNTIKHVYANRIQFKPKITKVFICKHCVAIHTNEEMLNVHYEVAHGDIKQENS